MEGEILVWACPVVEIYFNPLFEQTNEPTSGKVFFDDDITKQTKNYGNQTYRNEYGFQSLVSSRIERFLRMLLLD
jgi:hypothetical protein